MATPQRIQPSDPEWGRLAREISEGAFVREGTFVAFPLCFPGVTIPIPREESRIHTLTTDSEGMVYGATTGAANHVFFACFQGTSGIVLDLKWPDPSAACPAIACGKRKVLFAANSATGGSRLLRRRIQGRPGDLLHEWSFQNHPFEEVPGATFTDPILGIVSSTDRRHAVVSTRKEIALYGFEEGEIVDRHSLPVVGKLCSLNKCVFGIDDNGSLFRYRLESRALGRIGETYINLTTKPFIWAVDQSGRWAYLIDGTGRIFQLHDSGGLTGKATLPIAPVTAATVTTDGRLFAFAGEGIAHFHVFDPVTNTVKDHGAAASVLERRRYGYAFASATTGQNGECFFGENDDLGHLWIYFPTIGT